MQFIDLEVDMLFDRAVYDRVYARSPLTSFVASCAGHRPALVIIADRVQCDCHIVRECYRSLCRILSIQQQEHQQ
jgi:hypothetical protein